MTLCITVDLEYYHTHLRLSIVSVGLFIIACIAVGTRKWSSVLIGDDCNYACTCSLRFMYALHAGGCGLDLPKLEQPWLPRLGHSLRHWIKRVRQANYA